MGPTDSGREDGEGAEQRVEGGGEGGEVGERRLGRVQVVSDARVHVDAVDALQRCVLVVDVARGEEYEPESGEGLEVVQFVGVCRVGPEAVGVGQVVCG